MFVNNGMLVLLVFQIASEGLNHQVLKVEDVQIKNVLTNWGMDFTTDQLRSLASKWHILIEDHNDVKTTDNFTLRMFCIRFTK
ncbi:hypothetical protein MKX03_006147 [Papaver bracteatum]|nr:hypothetical protein MKX03_006147 [Papaver bracteatum]